MDFLCAWLLLPPALEREAKWKLSLIRLSFNFIFSPAASPSLRSRVKSVKNCYYILQVQHYILVVQAQDNGHPSLSSTLTVYCNVIDLNDNAPVFDPMSYSNEIYENVPIGTEVVTVSATDTDSGVYSLFWSLNFILALVALCASCPAIKTMWINHCLDMRAESKLSCLRCALRRFSRAFLAMQFIY